MGFQLEIQAPGLILLSHGSRDVQANAEFNALAMRLGQRLGCLVGAAYISNASPGLSEEVQRLYNLGKRKINILPYFLHRGVHVLEDIPALLEPCRASLRDLEITLQEPIGNDPGFEDLLVDRLGRDISYGELPTSGRDIEARSHAMLNVLLKGTLPENQEEMLVVRRMVHATGDIAFARSVRFSPGAVQAGIKAIRAGAGIFVDVGMLQAGITKAVGNRIICGIDDPELPELAKAANSTRAAQAVEKYADAWAGGILAVGNAPTALWQLMDMCRRGARPPALTLGLPVGFVGAAEAKAALLDSGLACITNVGRRGGSPVAAAAVNALALMAREDA